MDLSQYKVKSAVLILKDVGVKSYFYHFKIHTFHYPHPNPKTDAERLIYTFDGTKPNDFIVEKMIELEKGCKNGDQIILEVSEWYSSFASCDEKIFTLIDGKWVE